METNKLKLLYDKDSVYPYPWYFAEQCITDDIKDVIGRKFEKTIFEVKDGHFYSYMNIEELNWFGKFLFEKVKSDRDFYKVVEKNILLTGDDLMSFCNKIKKIKYKKISNQQLFEIFDNYSKKIRKMRTWGWIPVLADGMLVSFLSDYIQDKLKQYLGSISKINNFPEYYSLLSSNEKESEIQQELLGRLKIINKIKKHSPNLLEILIQDSDKFIEKIKEKNNNSCYILINKHVKKFEWLTYNYNGPKLSIENVVLVIKEQIEKKVDADKQIKEIEKHFKEIKKKKKELIKEISLPSELEYLFLVSSFFMYIKDWRKGVYQKSYVLMDPIIDEISDRLKISSKEVKFLTNQEIYLALLQNKDFSEVLKQRLNYCVCVVQNGDVKIYQQEQAEVIIKEEIDLSENKKDEESLEIQEIKGSIAYSGKVTGIAKIILTVDNIPKINDGEVLVSASTNPDLILAMTKASAFVTDNGGITSHAAIVSREMKKPCIVGTKIATKVIGDGDLIEVDANKGLIKILKKYEKNKNS